jgi:ribonucleoside-diphosphate reductase alpha chain
MEENLRNELVQRIAHELTSIGQKTDNSITEEQISAILDKCLQSVKAADAELILSLASQAVDIFQQGVRPDVTEIRPQVLECDVVRFQNNREKWVALVGLLNGYPYEIFTGLADDEEGIVLPKNVTTGKIIKQVNPDGTKRYDFQFENKRGYKTTVEGLSEKFNPEYWNYAKLISGVLRYRMPIEHVIKLVASLSLKDESINTWKTGVERALKKYAPGAHEEEDVAIED